MPARALIFDLDGLIVDTEGPEFRSWLEEFEAHGVSLRFEAWQTAIGTAGAFDPYDHLEELLGAVVDRDAVRARRRARFDELMNLERLLPGVERLFGEARDAGLALGLASSSTREWVTHFIERFELTDVFDVVRAREDVAAVKPAPDLYLAVLEALRVRAGDAIALEDSPNGVRAAKAARLFCVAVPNALTSRMTIEGADLTVASLDGMSLEDLLAAADGVAG